MAKVFYAVPEWRNFAKSGHIVYVPFKKEFLAEAENQFQQRGGYDKDIRDIVRYFEASCRVDVNALPQKVFLSRAGASSRSFQFRQQESQAEQDTLDQVRT